jgi:hypothetical protein
MRSFITCALRLITYYQGDEIKETETDEILLRMWEMKNARKIIVGNFKWGGVN